MTEVKTGDTVRIHYTGTLEDGTVFDSSEGRDPLEFTVGSGQIIPGLDAAIPGMSVGDTKTVPVPAEQAYGERDVNARQEFPRDQVPEDVPIEEGTRLMLSDAEGRQIPVVITDVTDQSVVLDANHPLAGKDLNFDIEVVDID